MQLRYTLKTPYRDGTTHVMFEPEDFINGLLACEFAYSGVAALVWHDARPVAAE